jgi:hypothetical protein
MSNSIWKTDGLREASTKKLILYFAGGGRIPYTGWNHPDIMMLSASNESWWNYTDVMRWCYADDLIAQADKAERLQKAVDSALEGIQYIMDYGYTDPDGHYEDLQSLYNKINQLIKG